MAGCRDEYCEGCEGCLPGGWACGRCDAIGTEDDPDYGGLCQECKGEDMAADPAPVTDRERQIADYEVKYA